MIQLNQLNQKEILQVLYIVLIFLLNGIYSQPKHPTAIVPSGLSHFFHSDTLQTGYNQPDTLYSTTFIPCLDHLA